MKFIEQAFAENWIAPLGPNVSGFETDLCNYLGSDSHVAALNSGTGALHLALVILDVQRGDEVLCQSMTFAASTNVITYVGATPILIDSETDTWNMCPDALKQAIDHRISLGKKPKAIIAVSLYGMPYKVREIHEIAAQYQIPVIEDSAESLGSSYCNQKMGTFGDIGILSFNGNKIITTSGGGAFVSKNKEFRDKAVFLSTQAKDDAPHYEHTQIGYNYRMSNVSAGIGRGQMEVLEDRIKARRNNHEYYATVFKNRKGITLLTEPNADFYSNHWLSAILVDEKQAGFNRDELRLAFLEENIESRPLWKPMHRQPVFQKYPFYGNGVAEQLFNDGLCLPSGSNLTEAEKSRIAAVIEKIYKN